MPSCVRFTLGTTLVNSGKAEFCLVEKDFGELRIRGTAFVWEILC